ncbi:hypothetical protein GmHk_06G016028 [Glycine max]|nr:hypothetical protein GmHk_06G016028 [Glycine max]
MDIIHTSTTTGHPPTPESRKKFPPYQPCREICHNQFKRYKLKRLNKRKKSSLCITNAEEENREKDQKENRDYVIYLEYAA